MIQDLDPEYDIHATSDHELIGRILWSRAQTVQQRMAAAYVFVESDHCWRDYIREARTWSDGETLLEWAFKVLREEMCEHCVGVVEDYDEFVDDDDE